MTFSYSETDLTTDLAKVRLAIGDTDETAGAGVKPDNTNFADEELAVYITAAGSWQGAVAQALLVLANMYATKARSVQIGEVREDLTRTAQELRLQARDWEAKAPAAATSPWSGLIGFHGTDSSGNRIGHMFGKKQWGANPADHED